METAENSNKLQTITPALSSHQPALQPFLILHLTRARDVFWGPLSTGFLWPGFGSRRTIPHPRPRLTTGEEEVENSGVKLNPGRREVGGACFSGPFLIKAKSLAFISHYATLI